MAVTFRGAYNSGGAANPTTALDLSLSGCNAAAGDLAIIVIYSRASAKTWAVAAKGGGTAPAAISGQDVNNVTYGRLAVYQATLSAQDITNGHIGTTGTFGSITNGTTGFIVAVFRGHNSVRGGTTPATGTGDPNPPNYSSTSGDCLIAVGGGMDQNDGITASANFTLNASAAWSSSSGTDAWSALEYDLDGGTGSGVDPAVMATSTDSAWYTTVIGISGDVPQTATPTGIASAQAVGTPVVKKQHQEAAPTGIASAEAVGAVTLDLANTITPNGWAQLYPGGDAVITWGHCDTDDDASVLGAVGGGLMYLSFDGGATWDTYGVGPDTVKNRCAVAIDADGSVIIQTENGVASTLSTNSGSSWAATGPSISYPYHASVDDDGSVLWVVNYGYRCHLSVNGGTDWTEPRPNGDVDVSWQDQACDSDGSVLIAAGDFDPNRGIYVSVNSGAGWTRYRPGISTVGYYSVACDGTGAVILACEAALPGKCWLSTDTGATWVEAKPAGETTKNWRRVAVSKDGSTLIAVVSSGRVYLSLNRGGTWTEQQPAGDSNQSWDGAAISADGKFALVHHNRLYAYGYHRFVHYPLGIQSAEAMGSATATRAEIEHRTLTPAGIASAEAIGTAAPKYNQIPAPSGIASAEAVGAATATKTSNIIITTASWAEIRPDAGDYDRYWRALGASADGKYFIAGNWSTTGVNNSGRIYRSTDYGATWAEIDAPIVDYDGWDAAASDSDGSHQLIGVGWNDVGYLDRTTNGGSSWASVTPYAGSYPNWVGAAISADGAVMLVGGGVEGDNSGRLYRSTNSGTDWSELQPAGAINRIWRALSMSSDGEVMLAGANNGRLWLSTNGGDNWTEATAYNSFEDPWYCSSMSADGAVMLAGRSQRLYHSIDGGANWHDEQPDGDNNRHWHSCWVSPDGTKMMAAEVSSGGSNTGRLWYHNGTSWAQMYPAGDVAKSWALVVGSSTGATIAAVGYQATGRLYRSTCNGQDVQTVLPTGVASGQEVGTVTIVRAYSYPAGIPSAEAIGTPTILKGNVSRAPTGIDSAEAIGVATRLPKNTALPTGIASAEAVGSVTVLKGNVDRAPSGIASAEAVGTATTLKGTVTRTPTGVASAEAVGTATRVPANAFGAAGIASAEAIGTVTALKGNVTRTCTGIASVEAIGSCTVTLRNLVSNAGGIASEEAIGTAKWHLVRLASGIASAEAVGAATRSAAISRSPSGIPTSEAVGAATAAATAQRAPTGVASGESVGTATRLATNACAPAGIASAEAEGAVTVLKGGVSRTCTGIASEEAFGSVTVTRGTTVYNAGGIPSEEAVGAPKVNRTVLMVGLASAEAMGVAARLATFSRSVSGVPSAEAVGGASAVHSDAARAPAGVESAEAFGSVQRLCAITRSATGIASAESCGAATRAPGPVSRTCTGIDSGEQVGSATTEQAGGDAQTRALSGIGSGEAVGTATTAQGGVTRSPAGVSSAEAIGTPTRLPTNRPAVVGIASGEFIGEVTVLKARKVTPTGIASGEQVGSPARLPGPVSVTLNGIPSAEAPGSVSLALKYTATPLGIASLEAFGTPDRFVGGVTRIVLGIPSAEAIGTVWAGSDLQLVYPTGIASAFQVGHAWVLIESDTEVAPGGRPWRPSKIRRTRLSSKGHGEKMTKRNDTGRSRT